MFDPFERTDALPSGYAEPTFAHLNRRAGSAWDRIRQLLEAWYTRLDPASAVDVRSRFRSNDENGFRSAFYEMYLNEVLWRSGWQVSSHPEIDGTKRRPDFHASRGLDAIFVEATTTYVSKNEHAAQAREDRLIDDINRRMEIGDFMLDLDVEQSGSATVPSSRLCKDIERWLTTLDADALVAARAGEDQNEPPTLEWVGAGWRLHLTAWALEGNRRGPGGRIVGSGLIDAGWIDDVTPLQRRLLDKARAYGRLAAPYIIGVDAYSGFTGDADVVDALYGASAVVYHVNPGPNDPPPRQARLPDGVWRGRDGWEQTQISGVLTTTTLKPWTVGVQIPTLWHHPSPAHACGSVAALFRQAQFDSSSSTIRWHEPQTPPWTFFDLDEGWPHFEAARS